MSDREQKLVLLFGLAAFVLINFFGISKFRSYRATLAGKMAVAEAQVGMAEKMAEDYEGKSEDMDWLAKHFPEPKIRQNVETELEKFTDSQAVANQLTVSKRTIVERSGGGRLQRAAVQFEVTGMEMGLYKWLGLLQNAEQFRAITFIRLRPDKDDTKIDCTVVAEQWYLPASEEDAGAEAEAPPEN